MWFNVISLPPYLNLPILTYLLTDIKDLAVPQVAITKLLRSLGARSFSPNPSPCHYQAQCARWAGKGISRVGSKQVVKL